MTIILACTCMVRFQNTVFIRTTLSVYSPRKLKSFNFLCLQVYMSEQKVSLTPLFIWGRGRWYSLARWRITHRLRLFWKSQKQQSPFADTLCASQHCTIQDCAGPMKQISLPRWCCNKAITPHVIKITPSLCWWQSWSKHLLPSICPATYFFPAFVLSTIQAVHSEMPSN